MLDTLSTKLVVLATTVSSAVRDSLADVREFAAAADKLVWAAMVWFHVWSTEGMMTHEVGRTGRFVWSFFPDPDSTDTAPFSTLVECEVGSRNRVYSSIKMAALLSECRRKGDKLTAAGWMALCRTYGLTTGDEVVAVAGPLARKFQENPDRSVQVVEDWIEFILNPPETETETETEPETEPEPTATNGHDVGATASPTYASVGARLISALEDYRLLEQDDLIVPTDDEIASVHAAVEEWNLELPSAADVQ